MSDDTILITYSNRTLLMTKFPHTQVGFQQVPINMEFLCILLLVAFSSAHDLLAKDPEIISLKEKMVAMERKMDGMEEELKKAAADQSQMMAEIEILKRQFSEFWIWQTVNKV